MSSTPTASSSGSSATPTTPLRRSAALPYRARAASEMGRPRERAEIIQHWRSAASASTSWPMPPASPRPTPSTCSATWPSTPRCAPAASGRSASSRIARTSSTATVRGPRDPGGAARKIRRARRRPVRAARRAQGPAHLRARQIGDIVNLFGGADQLRAAVSELQNLLYAA